MIRFALPVAVAVIGLSVPAFAADPPSQAARPETAMPGTVAFEKAVAGGTLFEIESSKLALGRSRSGAVKAFATRMIDDHTAAAAGFKQAVAEAGLAPPAETLDPRQRAALDDLRKKEGPAFDKAYVDAQHDAHVETVDLFEAYARQGDNARLKMFAQDLLPTLQTHLDLVDKLR